MAAGREARDGSRPGRHFAGAAFDGQKFRILAFALQCVSVNLYLFLIYSVHWGRVLPVGGAAPRTFAPGGKNPRTATAPTLWQETQLSLTNRDAFVQMQRRGWPPENTPLSIYVTVPNLVVLRFRLRSWVEFFLKAMRNFNILSQF